MNYQDAVLLFVSEFPEFKIDLDSHIQELDEILPYVFFPQVFHEYIEEIIKTNNSVDWIKRFFDFLEMMACREEDEVINLLSLTFLDNMRDDLLVLENSRKMCGKKTSKYLDDILRFYGQLPPLTVEGVPFPINSNEPRKRPKKKIKDVGKPYKK